MLHLLMNLVVWTAAAGSWSAAPADESGLGEIRQLLARRVTEVFSARCTECHGSHLARPKGRFGYILNLKHVAANPEIVVPFEPGNSHLYMLVSEDEMPPPDSDAEPTNKAEKQVIRLWIAAGAPSLGSDDLAGSGPAERAPKKTPSTPWRLVHWLGRFHPASVHFPIALLLVAALAELLVITSARPIYKDAGRFCVLVAALTAVLTTALGWANAVYFPVSVEPTSTLLLIHRWLGTSTAGWALLIVLLSELRRQRDHARWLLAFRIVLFLGAIFMVMTSFFGGSLVYGIDHYRW